MNWSRRMITHWYVLFSQESLSSKNIGVEYVNNKSDQSRATVSGLSRGEEGWACPVLPLASSAESSTWKGSDKQHAENTLIFEKSHEGKNSEDLVGFCFLCYTSPKDHNYFHLTL